MSIWSWVALCVVLFGAALISIFTGWAAPAGITALVLGYLIGIAHGKEML